jgi:hypothetical protein
VIVRRERPHPRSAARRVRRGRRWRCTAFATDTSFGQLAHLDARHRKHARVEDRIRCAKDTGLGLFRSRSFAINLAWLSVVMLAVDLIAWTQHLLLHGDLARAEPKTLRYRLRTSPPASPVDSAGSGCASSGPGRGRTTSRSRSPGPRRCPFSPADLPTRHDERPPAEPARRQRQMPILRTDSAETDNRNYTINSRSS